MKRAQIVILSLLCGATAQADVSRETVNSGGRDRTYYFFVPGKVSPAQVPLLILLHGSGRNGRVLVDHWRRLAEREGIVLAGPDSLDSSSWRYRLDGPQFLRDVVEAVKLKANIDPRRVFLFGHSAGGSFALQMSMIESEYFAATVAHAGGLPQSDLGATAYASRKIPILIVVGEKDFTPRGAARKTHDVLQKASFPNELREIPRHTHDYYGRSREINELAWVFLSKNALSAAPKYVEYAE